MKRIFILLFLFSAHCFFGQKIFYAQHPAYKENGFSCTLYLYKDSTCFLKGRYKDNSTYYLCKGRMKKLNDTLYDFSFQPLVSFGCNKYLHTNDSVGIYVSEKDTVFSSLLYKVKVGENKYTTIDLRRNNRNSRETRKHVFA